MNAVLVKQALEKVINPQVLINMVSQRVRQLVAGHGSVNRPLVADVGNLGAADIALREIIEDKMSFEMPELIVLIRPTARGRKRPQHWVRNRDLATDEEGGDKEISLRKRALKHG